MMMSHPTPGQGASSAAELLQMKNVGKSFGALEVLRDIDLTLHKGEVLGIVGESGSGKSTLGRIAIGLDLPSRGEVLLNGRDVLKPDAREKPAEKWRMQMVFQDSLAALDPRYTIADSIREPWVAFPGRHPANPNAAIDDLIDAVGLKPEHKDRLPHQLSGGQRQRACIARAIAVEPDVIVLDEPTSSLDATVQAQILALLLRLRSERGISYILISHDIGVVRTLSDKIGVLHKGRMVDFGAAEDVLNNPGNEYTQHLMSAVLPPSFAVRELRRSFRGGL
ncbi:ABC transporter ATP-binding protein [Aquamicrobium soli]|uniref:ABC transporter ATP-binding protein n=1 Tax=Aquamicrobium soli TaxID=1811518 RepID=A0ABV7K5G3_9HYPH